MTAVDSIYPNHSGFSSLIGSRNYIFVSPGLHLAEYWVDKASNGNNFLVLARDLSVTWGEDSRYWHWPYIKETMMPGDTSLRQGKIDIKVVHEA
ncbi:hypothetical protein Tco_0511546 [Tanacetum coccineum]